MPQIDGKNYIKPGAFVPGGNPDLVYLTRADLADIQLNFPADQHQGMRARANDLNADVISRLVGAGPAWDWQQDNPATTVLESFTIKVFPWDASIIGTGPDPENFRFPYAFNIQDIRASLYSINSCSADAYIQGYKIPAGGAPIPLLFEDPMGPPYPGLITVLCYTAPVEEYTSFTSGSPIAFVPGMNIMAEDDELIFYDIGGSGAEGLTITILGYRL